LNRRFIVCGTTRQFGDKAGSALLVFALAFRGTDEFLEELRAQRLGSRGALGIEFAGLLLALGGVQPASFQSHAVSSVESGSEFP
jgi:hypothetical protein